MRLFRSLMGNGFTLVRMSIGHRREMLQGERATLFLIFAGLSKNKERWGERKDFTL